MNTPIFVSAEIRQSYNNCECPDCGKEIPYDVEEGEECSNCGHAFFLPTPNDD